MGTVRTKSVDTIRHLSASIGATPKPRRESILLFIAITSSTQEEHRRIIGLLAAQDFRYWHALPRRCVPSQRERVSLLNIEPACLELECERDVSSVRDLTLGVNRAFLEASDCGKSSCGHPTPVNEQFGKKSKTKS